MHKQKATDARAVSQQPRSNRAAELGKAIDGALDDLAAALEKGRSAPLRRYLAVMGRFHRYSFGNQLLIAHQCPDAEQVAGFHAWRRLGRRVKRGARAIRILAPVRVHKTQAAKGGERAKTSGDEQEESDRTGQRLAGFRVASVFDIRDTVGEELPTLRRTCGDPGQHLARLTAFIESRGIKLKRVPSVFGAMAASLGGEILIRSDLEGAEACTTLIHEVAHELMHQTRRPKKERRSNTVEETEAEAVACVVSEALGLTATDAAADYIQLYRGDKKTLYASLERIQRTAREILAGITAKGRGATEATMHEADTPTAGA